MASAMESSLAIGNPSLASAPDLQAQASFPVCVASTLLLTRETGAKSIMRDAISIRGSLTRRLGATISQAARPPREAVRTNFRREPRGSVSQLGAVPGFRFGHAGVLAVDGQGLSLGSLRCGEFSAILVQDGERQEAVRDVEMRVAVKSLALGQRLLEERQSAIVQPQAQVDLSDGERERGANPDADTDPNPKAQLIWG